MATEYLLKTLYGKYLDLKIYYVCKSQNTSTKKTTLTLKVYGYYDGSTSTTASSCTYKIGLSGSMSTVRTSSYTVSSSSRTVLLGSKDVVVTHTEQEFPKTAIQYSFYDSFNFTTTQAGTVYIAKGASGIPDIPFKATVVSAPNFNNESSPVLNYSNPLGNSVYSLDACISLTGATSDIAYRSISKTGTSYTFNLTTAEKNTLINAVSTTAKSRTVRFYVRTKLTSSSDYEYDYVTKTFSLVNGEPVIGTPTITDTGASVEGTSYVTTDLTGNASKLIRYLSFAEVAIPVTTKHNATVASYKVVNGSNTVTGTSSPLTVESVDSDSFVITVTDSRGLTATKTVTATALIAYKPLTVGLKLEVTNPATGTVSYKVFGDEFSGSFGSVTNTVNRRISYRVKGASSWTQTANLSNYEGTLTLDHTKEYEIKAISSDKITTTETVIQTVNFTPSFYWDKDNFYFNQNVYIKSQLVNIPKIESGYVSITPSAANTPTSQAVTFSNEYDYQPVVVATAWTAVPGTYVLGVGVGNFTKNSDGKYTGCSIYLTRTNTGTTGVFYIVMENTTATLTTSSIEGEIIIDDDTGE